MWTTSNELEGNGEEKSTAVKDSEQTYVNQPYQLSSIWDSIPRATIQPIDQDFYIASPLQRDSYDPSYPNLDLAQYFEPSSSRQFSNQVVDNKFVAYSRPPSPDFPIVSQHPVVPQQFYYPRPIPSNLEITSISSRRGSYESSTTSSTAGSSPVASSSGASLISVSGTSRPTVMPYRAGVNPFVTKLYWILEQEEYSSVIRWKLNGDAFIVDMTAHKFVNDILPSYFNHTNITSFCRQLQLYKFDRLSTEEVQTALLNSPVEAGSDWRAYHHEHMTREDSTELHLMKPRQSKARINKRIKNAERKHSFTKSEEGDSIEVEESEEGGNYDSNQKSSPASTAGNYNDE